MLTKLTRNLLAILVCLLAILVCLMCACVLGNQLVFQRHNPTLFQNQKWVIVGVRSNTAEVFHSAKDRTKKSKNSLIVHGQILALSGDNLAVWNYGTRKLLEINLATRKSSPVLIVSNLGSPVGNTSKVDMATRNEDGAVSHYLVDPFYLPDGLLK